jgi:predicted dienelactone hydrolase
VAVSVGFAQSLESRTNTILPALSGHFAVGRASFDWTDESRTDSLAPEANTKRQLTVWIWYPASVTNSSTSSEYIPAPWRAALAKRQSPEASKMWRDPALVRCHSFDKVQVAPEPRTFPIVIMKPGIGALALDYTTLCEDLASHGYVVVASDSPHNTFLVVYKDGREVPANSEASPRGTNSIRVLETWTADNRFVLDRLVDLNKHDEMFQGRLDMTKVGVIGHSFGGATAAQFCNREPRCKAGVDLDGQLYGEIINTGINRPFMFLLADHLGSLSGEDQRIAAELKAIYEHSAPGREYVTLRDSGHFNFSDKCLLLTGTVPRQSNTIGKIDGRRGLVAAAACISTFFDVHLKGEEPSLWQRLPSQYPELTFGPDNH